MITDTYKPGHSLLHRFDPRPKLILLVATLVIFFLPVSPIWLLPYATLLSLLILFSLGPKELALPILTILPVLLFVAILTPPFHRGGDPLIVIWKQVILTTNGLQETARMILRFTGITLAFFLYLRTTAINDLILALRWFGLPFKAALVATLAFRYIPYMAQVYANVVDAHRLRSDPNEEERRWWELRKRVRRLLPVLTSVLIYAIKGIPMLSMALESRGMGRKNPRADYIQLKQGSSLLFDFLATLLVLCLLLIPLIVLIHH